MTRARVTSWQSLGGLLGPARLLLSFVSAAVWGNVAAAAVPAFADVVQPLGRDLVCAARVPACAKRLRFVAKVSKQNQLFKARRILNLKKDATLDDAKRARKKIALEHHPDKNPSKKSHEIFGYSEAAYEVLAADFKEKKRAAEAAEKAAATPRS